jgi:hypothetical protein
LAHYVAAMFTKMIGALGIAMALSSCATVIRGVHEDLKVVSNPSGADVNLSTGERGVTPATFSKRDVCETATEQFSGDGEQTGLLLANGQCSKQSLDDRRGRDGGECCHGRGRGRG